jgi:hypothetical protein
LAAGRKAIVLADGTYGSTSYFSDAKGSSIYAQHLGGAVLTASLAVGGNFDSGGAVVQGLAFNVSSPSNVFQGGEIQTWGAAGANTHVLDCTFEGNRVVPVGLFAYNPAGLVARRLVFTHFTDVGLRASDNVSAAYGSSTPVISLITDISVIGVTRVPAGSSDGTAEAGLWIGEPVRGGVHRIKVRNVSISGIETVNNAWNTSFTDLDIDMSGPNQSSGVGVYMEHFSRNLVFTNFLITGARCGFNAEWDDGTNGNGAAHDITIQNGTIDAAGSTLAGRQVGAYLDQGTETTTINNVTFKNQKTAGIVSYLTIGTNTFADNTFQLPAGAVPITATSPGN